MKDNKSEKSVIISLLDKFAGKIYGLLEGGIFGRLFTSYSSEPGFIVDKITKKNKVSSAVDGFRRKTARVIENSAAYNLYLRFLKYLLSVRVKVYGTAVMTFFLYSFAVSMFVFLKGDVVSIPVDAITYLLFSAACLPLVLSGATLYDMLGMSGVGKRILSVTGNRAEGYQTYSPRGRCNIAFLIGTVFGLLTFFVQAETMWMLFMRAIWAITVFHSPEFGIVSLFFLMPFEKTMMLVAEVGVVCLSYLFKLILGKRVFRLEAVDIAALMFAIMTFVGGVFSMSPSSVKPMLVYLCFMCSYFLIVNLIRSEEWVRRCVLASVISGTAVALYGVFQYATGMIGFSKQWLDTEMFGDISGRAISTLENPNVLGEYLVMIIPMAAFLFIFRCTELRSRFITFVAFAGMCACLVVTWSRGAWLGIILAALVFCLIWSKRTLHMFWVALLALPFLPAILPDNILARITSIGNVADTSTAYRLSIWLGTVKMLPERILSGIGIGTDAWKMVYPDYALAGAVDVQHSHSLYFQIWVELGALALVIFVVFVVMMLMSTLTMCNSLSRMNDSLILKVYTAPVKDHGSSERVITEKDDVKNVDRKRCELRMSAAAPVCGVLGILLQGFTDNIWYNYRVYLMFWLCIGLSVASANHIRKRIVSAETLADSDDTTTATAEILISRRNEKKHGKKIHK